MKTSNVAPAKKTATVSEAYTKIIEEMRTPSKPRSLGQYYADWNEKAKKIAADEEAEAFFKNIKAEDVGVATGAAMTEEQFHKKMAVDLFNRTWDLLDKPERRETEVPIHYRGFSISNKFVFGYGLDLDEYYRNLPFVAVVDTTKYHPGE